MHVDINSISTKKAPQRHEFDLNTIKEKLLCIHHQKGGITPHPKSLPKAYRSAMIS
jgi:hypothetical protein